MTPSEQWLTDCRAAGVDPLVIEHTARNFLAHLDYHSTRGSRSLPLAEWFRYYALENAAELSAETIKVEGCSVDERSVRPPSADYRAAIFQLLQRFLEEQKTPR
ncbi:MAG: hypothetical protein RL321_1094 [Pseudomonadota bacterium]|jgi:hypothetical protein